MAKRDRITFGLYSVQEGEGFNLAAINEIKNIVALKVKFEAAAQKTNREPPEIVLSVLLIPDWKNQSSFDNETYKAIKDRFISAVNTKIKEYIRPGENPIVLEDFYCSNDLSQAEKDYLTNLQAKGSNADMIKTHAIIRNDNLDRRHLQIDTNTKIYSVEGLYNQTFGSKIQLDALDALNASFYDISYVSAHNKIVYTAPNGKLAKALKAVHLEYCQFHAKDGAPEKTEKNSIYARDFAVALSTIGLTIRATRKNNKNEEQIYYPAVMEEQVYYRITRYVITAVSMSWADIKDEPISQALKELPEVEVADAKCGYSCFAMIVKKYTGDLKHHVIEGNIARKL